jgi:hypothetical protein
VAKHYQRRAGVIRRSGQLGSRPGSAVTGSPNVIDGGDDAPLSELGRWMYHWIIGGIIVIGVALMLIFR